MNYKTHYTDIKGDARIGTGYMRRCATRKSGAYEEFVTDNWNKVDCLRCLKHRPIKG